jgi:hypothetical protein
MRKYALRTGIVAATLAAALSFGHFRVLGQGADSKDPMYGTWIMDITQQSENNRAGRHQHSAIPAMRVMEREGDSFRMSFWADPTTASPQSYVGKFDGREYPDPRAPGRDATLAHWRINPNLIVRLRRDNGKPAEWVIYTLSSDGNVFTATSWDPKAPELQDFQVYNRKK